MFKETDVDLFVAPDGNDRWSGKLPQPDSRCADGPFATLERARDAIRQLKAGQNLTRPLTVMLRGGTYRLLKPFILRPEDSGASTGSVIYAAYPGEKPIISGGKTISGLKQAEGALWAAELPEVKSGDWCFRQLFVNGRRRNRARFPREGILPIIAAPPRHSIDWAGTPDSDDGDNLNKKAFQFRPGDIRRVWRNLSDVEVVVLQYWMAPRMRIESIDEENHVVLFTGKSRRPFTWSNGYYIDNVFEGMDAPGSWYLDREKGILFYHRLPEEDIDKVEVVAPVTEQLVRLEGDVDGRNFVSNVGFRGLAFCHTSCPLPEEGYVCHQAEITPPAAIHAEGAVRCRIENCELAHLGGWGIEFGRGCKDNAIVKNTIRDVGAGCVKIGEPTNCKENEEEACGTVISDNRFLEGGQVYLGPAAVWIGQSGRNTISHNEISGPFMWGVSVGWNWNYFPLNRARDNLVEYNHVHHLGTGILGTHGAIYCLGVSPGTVIRNNYIHHIFQSKWWKGAGEGIILDNGCSGILIENNVVHDAVAGGWGCNFNCFGNIVINNIFANGTEYQLTRYGDAPPGTPPPNGEVFARNIIVWKDGPLIRDKDWWNFQTLWNCNLYFHTGGEPVKFMKHTFEEWKAKGLDTKSIIADPMFVDPENGDYSLRPDSPAFKLGFEPIDVSDVGPRK